MAKRKISKGENLCIAEQILDDEYGFGIDGLTNKELLEISGLLRFIGENRSEEE